VHSPVFGASSKHSWTNALQLADGIGAKTADARSKKNPKESTTQNKTKRNLAGQPPRDVVVVIAADGSSSSASETKTTTTTTTRASRFFKVRSLWRVLIQNAKICFFVFFAWLAGFTFPPPPKNWFGNITTNARMQNTTIHQTGLNLRAAFMAKTFALSA
jgi:hypothetical protein